MKRWICALLLVGCGTDDVTTDEPLLDGFEPPAPASDEIQIISPAVRGIAPGADVNLCSYIDRRLTEDIDILSYRGFQSSVGGHHTILYAVTLQEAANTHECNEDDMINARYLAGAGPDAPPSLLPDGVVFRIPANTQLMVNTHWINATDQPIDGQSAFNLKVSKPTPDHKLASLLTVGTTMFTLPMGPASTSAECTVEEGPFNVFTLGGHMHEWGTHAKISLTKSGQGASAMLWESDWSSEKQFNPPLNQYPTDAPLVLQAGDKLRIECDYDNDTGNPLPFPREMCVGFQYAYPMTKQLDCMDGNWPR